MPGFARAPVALLASTLGALGLPLVGCGDTYAPDEAPALATSASIPAAAPGAIGVTFDKPKPTLATGPSTMPPSPLPKHPSGVGGPVTPLPPTPLPTAVPPPSPFGEPPPGSATGSGGSGGGAATGPLPKGVQL